MAENNRDGLPTDVRIRASVGASTVIIVGEESRKVVTIARSLHRHGVRSIVAVSSGQSMRISSRAITDFVQLDGSVEESAQLLCMLAESADAGWVVPTSDSSLRVVSAAHQNLSRFCAVGCPPPDVVQRILDKSVTLETAVRCGVPVPASMSIDGLGKLEAALPQMRFPIVVKRSEKNQNAAREFEARTFRNAAELLDAFADQSSFGAELLFQPYYGAQRVAIEVLIDGGNVVASFQHRSLSESPPYSGAVVLAISEPVDPVLLEYAVRLLLALEWNGVAVIEFRHGGSPREAVFMEASGHFGDSLPLAVAAGVDFPLYAWQLSQNLTPTISPSYHRGLRMRWTAGSLKRVAHAVRGDDGERWRAWEATRELLADFRPGTKSGIWSWNDPAPALQEVADILAGWSNELAKQIIRTVVPVQALSIVKSARALPRGTRGIYVRRRIARLLGTEREVALPSVVNSVLFVCHGNIMRSASAAQFLRDDLKSAGIVDVRVSSAGTHARDGKAADPRVKRAARQLGVSLDDHGAALLTTDMVASHDVIFAMDDLNVANIVTMFPESRDKLMLFGGLSELGVYHPREIADPYLTDQAEVTSTIGAIRRYVAALALAIVSRRGIA